MSLQIRFRNYTDKAGITDDYFKVRAFLIRLGYAEFTYARWDWMTTHGYLEKEEVRKIGIWETADGIIGIATFDTKLGTAYCLTLPEYSDIKKELLEYSRKQLSKNDQFSVVIADSDVKFQDIAARLGFVATEEKENDAIFYIDRTSTNYHLPEGFRITSMKDTFDLNQYGRVLWKGFNHELNGEGQFVATEEKRKTGAEEMIRPNVDLSLKIAAVAPDWNFASYCGMWYDPDAGYAVIEPVATDPQYRRMGLGRAVVLEGIRRVGAMGAKTALVGSSQQFYYSIGLRPYAAATLWRAK